MTQATQKQRDFLVKLLTNKRNRRINEELDFVAETVGLDHWDDAPMTKRLASCMIDIFLGKADYGLYVWAVQRDRDEMAAEAV